MKFFNAQVFYIEYLLRYHDSTAERWFRHNGDRILPLTKLFQELNKAAGKSRSQSLINRESSLLHLLMHDLGLGDASTNNPPLLYSTSPFLRPETLILREM